MSSRSDAVAVVLLLAAAVFALPATGHAHGGQYRGPTMPGMPGGPAPPGTPGPGPTTGGPAGSVPTPMPATAASYGPDETSWQTWWEFNKDRFHREHGEARLAVTNSDEFYLGMRRVVPSRDGKRPDDRDRRDRIAPALVAMLRRERNRDLVTACLVGLAKLGVDAPGVDIDREFSQHLQRDDQEVRETAALAFGIAGRARSLALLSDLLADTGAGRRLVGRERVDARTRAFAAHSLGQLAMRAEDADLKRAVHDLLQPLLLGGEDDRDVLVAAVTSLGMLTSDLTQARDKRLAWQTVEELWTFYERDLGKTDQVVQAHVPTAVWRLLGRGTSAVHQRSKARLAAELTTKTSRLPAIRQSAALALGQLCLPAEAFAEDARYSELLVRTWREAPDPQARFFALLAAGSIGGAANRKALLELLPKANAATERPWVALALGLVAFESRRTGVVDVVVAEQLATELVETPNAEARAAFAVALGLTGHRGAVPTVLRLLHEQERDELLAGYLCASLGLLGDAAAIEPLGELMRRSVRRPFVLQQAAVALGQLGDERAVPLLLELLGKHDSTAALAAIANGLGQLADRRSIDPLIALLESSEPTKLARAFAAAALGGVGDKDEVQWNLPLCRDVNYRAVVDTLTNGKSGVLDIL